MDFSRSRELQGRMRRVVPGGCHTYAKGDDQYPELSPGFIARGEGCHVWDVDGNEFIEYGMGLRSVTLGHAFPEVVAAVRDSLALGTNFTRPASLELECAEAFLQIVDGADMVKFTKDGSTATTAALRLARAFTGRDLVGVCAEHPFFSYDDWFIGTTTMDGGIPESGRSLTVPFHFNDLASVEALFAAHPGQVAALFLEPARTEEPDAGFLSGLQALCRKNGAVLVFDEMITGFRWHLGGAQKAYGVAPTLSTFGKALANGFSLSALCGTREIMELGSGRRDEGRVFLLSTTHGAETPSLAAALATMDVYRREPVVEHLHRQGQRLAEGVSQRAEMRGLGRHVRAIGRPCNLAYSTLDPDGEPSQAFRTLFLQETIRRGVLMPSLVVSYSHSDEDIDRTLDAVDGALEVYGRALEDGVEKHLVGRPSRMVFERRWSS
ncbi:MAG: glutamate-1-semialdehyde 2,1-aminomutase [Acidobacteria bacterium]|nr:glutamate-1-semialdehyde 2,1-aminomutase [Acidobacteriota bacterium]